MIYMESSSSNSGGFSATVTFDISVDHALAAADGYDVYCGSSKKSQKGTVVKGTTKLTANKTKLTSGKTYYFRARAYKMVGSAKVYTGYSAVKSVKVK